MISPDPAVRAGAVVDEAAARLFSILESSYESVARLLQEVELAASGPGDCKLDRLRFHLTTSRRRLGELRSLRRFLDDESELGRDRRNDEERVAA